jgi:hypothetical protein
MIAMAADEGYRHKHVTLRFEVEHLARSGLGQRPFDGGKHIRSAGLGRDDGSHGFRQ